jgi:hypothetical protein
MVVIELGTWRCGRIGGASTTNLAWSSASACNSTGHTLGPADGERLSDGRGAEALRFHLRILTTLSNPGGLCRYHNLLHQQDQPNVESQMAQQSIFGPFFATMFLTLIVWVYMYIRRIHFINNAEISPNDLAAPGALARLSPAAISNPSDNLKNLFEMPVLFYALALYLFVTNQVDAAYVYAGWVFAAFRVLHSAVHCTFNLILLRFCLYAVSTVALWFIAIRAAVRYFGVL